MIKLVSYLIGALLVTLPASVAIDSTAAVEIDLFERTSPWATLQPCATMLIDRIRSQNNCSVTDIPCICGDGLGGTDTFEQFLANCSFPEALASQNTTSSTCGHPPRDKSSEYTIVIVTINVVTKTILIARSLHARFFSARRALGADDWIALVVIILGTAATAVNLGGLNANGLGRDIWTLSLPEISRYAFYLYIMTLFYVTEMMLLKLSFCFLYLRIFPSTTLRRLLWGTVIFHVLFGIACLISSVFICVPIDYTWLRYVGKAPGRCVNVSGLYWAYGAVTVATDFWLLALPLRPVFKLNIHWKKKAAIVIMLMTGVLATIVSIIRFRAILSFTTSANSTYDVYAVSVWSDVELNVGMICASLPSLRLLLARLWPRVFESNNKGTRVSHGPSHGVTFEIGTAAHGTFKSALSAETIRVGYTELAPVAPTKIHFSQSQRPVNQFSRGPMF